MVIFFFFFFRSMLFFGFIRKLIRSHCICWLLSPLFSHVIAIFIINTRSTRRAQIFARSVHSESTNLRQGNSLLPKFSGLLLVPSSGFLKISLKFVHNFLSNPANKQTSINLRKGHRSLPKFNGMLHVPSSINPENFIGIHS